MIRFDQSFDFGNGWLDLAEEHLEDRLTYILKMLDKKYISKEKQMYSSEYDKESIERALEETKKSILEGEKDLKRLYIDIEKITAEIETQIEKNDPSAISTLESLRQSIQDIRQTGQYYKDSVKEYIFEYMPELAGEKTAYEQYVEEKKEYFIKNKKDVNWATEDNAQRPNLFKDPNYVLLEVNIEDVVSHMHSAFKLDLEDEDGGDNAIGRRLKGAIEYIVQERPIDHPELGANDRNDIIDYTNGRHRTVAVYQLGNEYVPSFVYKETLSKFKELVRTRPYENKVEKLLKEKILNSENKPKNKLKRS